MSEKRDPSIPDQTSLESAHDYSDLPTAASRRFAGLIDTELGPSYQADDASALFATIEPRSMRTAEFILDPRLATTMNTEIWDARSPVTTGCIRLQHASKAGSHQSWSAEVQVDAEDKSRGIYCYVGYNELTNNSFASLKLLEERTPDDYIERELQGIFRGVAVAELTRATVRAEVSMDSSIHDAAADWSRVDNTRLLAEVGKRELTDRDVDQLARYLSQARWPTVQ